MWYLFVIHLVQTNMNLFRTSVLSGAGVVVKMITMLVINKVLAVYVGPSGYAMIGQLQNFIQISTLIATGSVNTGVTKYTAEYDGQDAEIHDIWYVSLCDIVIINISFINYNFLLRLFIYLFL